MIRTSRRINYPKARSATLLSAAIAAISCSAVAQQKAPLVLEEVIVTATKTEELASDIAISANVVSSQDLAKINAFDITEIAKLAPGLDFASTRDPVSGALKLRNVGSDSFEGGNDRAIAVFVDQFVQSVPNAVFSTMMDVERIEVLRGPQGTLYGKNAPAGVISITTRSPDYHEVSGYIKGNLSNYDTYTTEAAINVPLIDDKLAVRAAGVMGESDGYYYNAFLNGDSGDSNKKDSRIKFMFNPVEELTIQLAYRNANIESGVPAAVFDGPVPNSLGLGSNGGQIISDAEDLLTYSSNDRRSDTDIRDTNLTIEWDAGDFAITSLTGYSEFEVGMQGGNQGYPRNEVLLVNFSTTRQVVEELRINSYAGENLDWLAGIFYSHLSRAGGTSLPAINLQNSKIGETWGYYGNATYSLNDQWKVSLGLRYNDEKKALESFTPLRTSVRLSDNFYNTSGSLKLHYYATPDVMLYVALDSAYRSGDFNDFTAGLGLSPLVNVIPGASGFVDRFSEIEPEESEALEIGMKALFLDGRARANVAYFYQVFHDYQARGYPNNGQAVVVGGRPRALNDFISSVTVGIDKLVTQGIEADGQILLTENWSLLGGASYAYAVAEEYPNNLCARGEAPVGQLYCPADGSRLNNDPLWNANVELTYENSWDVFGYSARLMANYKNAPTYDNGSTVTARWDDYNSDLITLDASLTVTQEDWMTSLWVKNMTDERRPASEGTVPNTGDASMLYQAFIAPRTYGVTAQYNF